MLKKLGLRKAIEPGPLGLDVPPGQYVTKKFPVLTFGATPELDLKSWRFKISGMVEQEVALDWEQFMRLEKITVEVPFHCVTQWSRLENTWEGIAFSEVLNLVKPRPGVRYVMFHCFGGYTTNLDLDVLTDEDVLFAYRHDGELLAPDHGGPLRLVVPKRYGWKSAKWVSGMQLMPEDAPGFWEMKGYHMRGDPVKEERFREVERTPPGT